MNLDSENQPPTITPSSNMGIDSNSGPEHGVKFAGQHACIRHSRRCWNGASGLTRCTNNFTMSLGQSFINLEKSRAKYRGANPIGTLPQSTATANGSTGFSGSQRRFNRSLAEEPQQRCRVHRAVQPNPVVVQLQVGSELRMVSCG